MLQNPHLLPEVRRQLLDQLLERWHNLIICQSHTSDPRAQVLSAIPVYDTP